MKKVVSFLTMVCVLNVLMAGGLAGYLFATGRMDGVKGGAIVDLVRHRGTPVKFREQMFEILEPGTRAASGAATQGAATEGGLGIDGGGSLAASAEERIGFARQALEQQRLALENQAQELRHRQELLENLKGEVEGTLKKIEAAKKESEPKAATAETKAKEENFQKSLALYDELKSKQVKDLFIDEKSEEEAAGYLSAMEASRAGKIIGEFKSPEERVFIGKVLERIRTNGTGAALGTKAGADVAAAAPESSPGVTVP